MANRYLAEAVANKYGWTVRQAADYIDKVMMLADLEKRDASPDNTDRNQHRR